MTNKTGLVGIIKPTPKSNPRLYTMQLFRKGLGIPQSGSSTFETSTLLTTLVLLSRLISVVARVKASEAVPIKSSQAEIALRIDSYGKISPLDARLLQYGNSMFIPSHMRIVRDIMVIQGSGNFDESAITREYTLVDKTVGSPVIAGTTNGAALPNIHLARLPGQNSIIDFANIVEDALGVKPCLLQDLADKIASWFIPVIVGTSCIVFAIWVSTAFKIRHNKNGGSVGLTIAYTIAVLAVSCLCALGLAVPMVLIVTGGVAAKSGTIIKQASVAEADHKTRRSL